MSECEGNVLTDRKCFIKCTTLHKAPFNLAIGTKIEGKVRAKNAVGFGPWSYVSVDDSKVQLPPNKMNKPTIISKTGDSITITWAELKEEETNGIDVSSYKIGYSECNDAAYSDCGVWNYSADAGSCSDESNNLLVVCSEYQSLYDIIGLNAQKYYKIKIAARNSCGLGLYSEENRSITNICPTQPEGVVTEIEGANVDIKWDNQSDITAWEVLFQKKDKSWMRIDECKGTNIVEVSGKPQCSLLNSKIKTETGLDEQDLIVVKIRGSNANCSGPWSDENTGNAKIAACPAKMDKPKFLDETAEVRKDSITINWDKLTGLDAGGEGIEIINYVIEYTQLKELGGDDFEPAN